MQDEERTPITGEMSISEIVSRFPQTRSIFERHGVACLACSAATNDTVADAAQAHGIDAGAFVAELNRCLGRAGLGGRQPGP